MDKYAKLNETMKQAFGGKPAQPLLVGVVKAISGDTCTVQFGTITITGVRLKVEIGGETDRLLVEPVVGKKVLCGTLTGDLKDMVVLKSERVGKISYEENGLSIEIDPVAKKVKVANGTVSLKDLFEDIKSIISQLKVFTPSGPSGLPLPGTITDLGSLQTKINGLLK